MGEYKRRIYEARKLIAGLFHMAPGMARGALGENAYFVNSPCRV